jgi:23S rRNA (uracil1939-C5)-methyltransferase
LQDLLDAALGRRAPRVRPMLTPDGSDDADAPAPWEFRHKVHFVCARGTGHEPFVLGHFAAGAQAVVPVVECPVHVEAGNRTARAIQRACLQLRLPAATTDGGRGLVRHIVVRVGHATRERMATLVVTDGRDRRLRRLVEVLAEAGELPDGLHVNVLEGPSSWLFGPTTFKLHGRSWLREEVAGLSYLVAPTAFFQTNVRAAETLVRLVLDAIPPETEDVLDLYAGAGLFALPLARRGHRVTAVEEHPEAIEAGVRSQQINEIAPNRCRFVRARVEHALGRYARRREETHEQSRAVPGRGTLVPALAVVLDPPRAGCSPRVLTALTERLRPRVIAYVSGDPEALARDLRLLVQRSSSGSARYRVSSVQPVDMFPHTTHVEALAVLEREDASRTPRAPEREGVRLRHAAANTPACGSAAAEAVSRASRKVER